MRTLYLILPIVIPIISGIYQAWNSCLSRQQVSNLAIGTALVNLLLVFYGIRLGQGIDLIHITPSLVISLRVDEMTIFFVFLVAVIWTLVALYAKEYMAHERHFRSFYIAFTVSLGLMMGIGMASNLFTFYLFYEFMTLATYPLVTSHRTNQARQAGIQYLGYSLFGAALTLIALMAIQAAVGSSDFVFGGSVNLSSVENNRQALDWVYFAAMIGFGAKAGLYPLHAWLPKAHPVAPAPASGILSGLITKAGLLGIIRLTYYLFGPEFVSGSWPQWVLVILAIFTIFMGSLLAVRANKLKTQLAYSSMSQVSYALLGFLMLNQAGFIGGILQMFSHAMIKNLLFLTIGALMMKTGKEYVQDIHGDGQRMPLTFTAYTLGALSLIGIPSLSGFVSKYFIAAGNLQSGFQSLGYIGAAILVLSSVLTVGYTLPIAIQAFFPIREPGQEDLDRTRPSLEPSGYMTLPFAILLAGIILLGVYPTPFIQFLESVLPGL